MNSEKGVSGNLSLIFLHYKMEEPLEPDLWDSRNTRKVNACSGFIRGLAHGRLSEC
jgi:hypothetical protein